MNEKFLSCVRHFFAQSVFMSSIHYKAYNRLSEKQEKYRKITMWIAGITVLLLISEIIVLRVWDGEILNAIMQVLSFVGLIVTASSLIFNMFQKEDLSEVKMCHRNAAEDYKLLRDSYILFTEEIMSGSENENQLRLKSERMQTNYSDIGKHAPTTTWDDYKKAQISIGCNMNDNEEFTWSDDEIDRFLPESLRLN